MKSLDVRELKAESYYNAPIFLDEKYILTAPDVPVSKELIEKLLKWQFRQVLTQGQPCSKPTVALPEEEESGIQSTNLNDDLASEEVKKDTQVFFREI